MDNIGKILAGFDLGFRDIVKLNSYHQGSTGIPFPCLAYAGMQIEIEAIAMLQPPAED